MCTSGAGNVGVQAGTPPLSRFFAGFIMSSFPANIHVHSFPVLVFFLHDYVVKISSCFDVIAAQGLPHEGRRVRVG